ncbi:MAG: CAP domain-containing protein [Pseudomonadota bacterium]
MKKSRILFINIATACIFISGCGGGGDDSSPSNASPAPTTNAPTVFLPTVSVSPATYSDQDLLQAFARVNEIRKQTGLGLIAQNNQLDLAAQRHTNYLVAKQGLDHFERADLPYFSGVTWTDRANAAGYTGGIIDEVALIRPVLGAQAVNDFMSTAYHRIPFLNHANFDIGMGAKPSESITIAGKYFVLNFGYSAYRRQGAPNTPYVVWPIPGAVTDRVEQEPESPSPRGAGYAVSIHVDPGKSLMVQSFELRENGNVVPSYSLNSRNDPNLAGTGYVAILSPILKLKNATIYTANFKGLLDNQPLVAEWSFSTP